MPSYWLKLYTDILDDPKVAKLTDYQFRVFIMCLAYAKEVNEGGYLAPASDIAWRFRLPEKGVVEALLAMERAGIIAENDGRYYVVNFTKRQESPSPGAERVRRFREKKKMENSNNVTDDVTVTLPPLLSSPLLSSDSPLDSFTPAQTANAISSWGNNGARSAERLYQQVTGQISIPATSLSQALSDLETVLDHYGKNIDRAVSEGKEIFASWCNTTGKSGRSYSPTNTAWLGKWLEKIAPRPDAPATNTAASIADRMRALAEAAQKAR